MLRQILHEIENASAPVSLGELSHRLGIEMTALEGMIEFWVQKGRLLDREDGVVCTDGACGGNCAGISACPYTAKMPKSYRINLDAID